MSKKSTPFEISDYLTSKEDVFEYLRQVFEDGDVNEVAAALGHVAKARGMSELAAAAGLSRESLYKALSGERVPSSDTVFRIVRALGYRLTIEKVDTPTGDGEERSEWPREQSPLRRAF
jgi:probable addiction module antidote protein